MPRRAPLAAILLLLPAAATAQPPNFRDQASPPLDSGFEAGPSTWQATVSPLYDNGPFITHFGTGAGGADESVLEVLSLGLCSMGYLGSSASGLRLADDFLVDLRGWDVDTVTVFAYQISAPTAPTITAVTVRVWDGPPLGPSSSVIWGDTVTNRLIAADWTGVFRVSEITSGLATNRPIQWVQAELGLALPPGRYWLDWQLDGDASFDGPYSPPVTRLGQATSGDALVLAGGSASAITDGCLGTQQGLPFVLEGRRRPVVDIPTLEAGPQLLLAALLFALGLFKIRKASTRHRQGLISE